MAATIQVTPKQVENAANQLRNHNKNLKKKINELISAEASLSKMWEGDSKTAFENEFKKDIQKMEKFYQAIENYAKNLDSIRNEYIKAEQKAVNAIHKH